MSRSKKSPAPRLVQCATTWSMIGYPSPKREWSLERKMKESLSVFRVAESNLLLRLCSVDQEAHVRQRAVVAVRVDVQSYVAYVSNYCEAFAILAFGGNF